MTKTALLIFRDDFRVKDNPAFFYAASDFQKIIPVFIFNENYQGRKIGAAQKVFLHHILLSFCDLLKKKYGAKLIFRKGDEIDQIKKIKDAYDFDAIYFNKSYTPKEIDLEEKIAKNFADKIVKSFTGKILFEPSSIKNGAGECFKVFTPFSKECLKKNELIGDFLPEPKEFATTTKKIDSLELSELELLPKNEGNWHKNLVKFWEFDYQKIADQAADFLDEKLQDYSDARNRADKNGTSHLSPYFRFGALSPRIVFLAAQARPNHQQFALEILWREFAYHIAFFNPQIFTKEIKKNYAKFSWKNNKKNLQKWQKGQTGFDIVDAGMKELWATGVMHNRVRMIAASFLIKDLFIDWRIGEQYFFDCLVDGDMIVNAFSWQWVFGSGFDAAPYFRVFNPDLQQKKFDPKGDYCKKWLGTRIMQERIVDHDECRKLALAEYKRVA